MYSDHQNNHESIMWFGRSFLKRSFQDFWFRCRFFIMNWASRRIGWTDDTSRKFGDVVRKASRHRLALIYGNGPTLNILGEPCISKLETIDGLRVGINRSFKKVRSDLLLWTDSELWPELKPHSIPCGTTVVRIARPFGHPPYIRWWSRHRRLDAWDRKGLFFLRNTLVSALHLCYLSGIRRIVLFGVSLESAAHFYSDPLPGESLPPYEHHDRQFIDRVFLGYDIQRCVREVLEHLIEEGFDIRYVGESRFLGDLGLKGYPDFPALERDPEMVPFLKKESSNERT
ncbi:hypothetical protein [Wenzhouxiangella sp. EGI_FJ10409]|uniref:hypothetical protein n=1 Tax=Wenzhouxiangella sp. EGI_FJ10409 TaxID=3243767 RepID=UPI0035D6568F